jgi:hypothetical protein
VGNPDPRRHHQRTSGESRSSQTPPKNGWGIQILADTTKERAENPDPRTELDHE